MSTLPHPPAAFPATFPESYPSTLDLSYRSVRRCRRGALQELNEIVFVVIEGIGGGLRDRGFRHG
jgi:hypothetical protein